MLDRAEEIYYGILSGKYTPHEFLVYARNLKRLDPESYEYLRWLAKRYRWVFVRGDVLRPGVEKWKRPMIMRFKNYISNLLQNS